VLVELLMERAALLPSLGDESRFVTELDAGLEVSAKEVSRSAHAEFRVRASQSDEFGGPARARMRRRGAPPVRARSAESVRASADLPTCWTGPPSRTASEFLSAPAWLGRPPKARPKTATSAMSMFAYFESAGFPCSRTPGCRIKGAKLPPYP
jgi:hypothetical protein